MIIGISFYRKFWLFILAYYDGRWSQSSPCYSYLKYQMNKSCGNSAYLTYNSAYLMVAWGGVIVQKESFCIEHYMYKIIRDAHI